MRSLRFLQTYFNEHPVAGTFFLILGVLTLFAVLPLLVSLLPIRKVPLAYNLRNLQLRWKTTLVTGLAFTCVTAILTYMLAFIIGMQRLMEGSGNPGNVIVLSDGATDEAFSNLTPFAVEMLPADLQQMIEKDGKDYLACQEVYVIVTYVIPNSANKRRFVQMRGLDKPAIAGKVHEVELAAGTWPSEAGVREVNVTKDGRSITDTATEIVLGDGVARAFGADHGKETLAPGDVVEIGYNKLWVVTGVMSRANNTFGSEIWARDLPVQETFGRRNSYTAYVVRTRDARTAADATKALKNFRSDRNLQASPERVYYSKLSQTNREFTVAIVAVAIVMAIGGVLGIMNTMFAAISQRTKDIGVLRLMGYKRWQVFLSFQMESVLIALVGGALGILVAYVIADGRSATSIVSSGVGGGGKTIVLTLVVGGSGVAIGMMFSLLMGALGGVIPSLRAMVLRPLDSLK